MADNMQSLGLDASQLISGLASASSAFKAHAASVEDVVIEYVKYNQAGVATDATAKMILANGQALDVMMKNSASGWEANVTGINNYTKAIKDLASAQQLMAGAGAAQNLMKAMIPDASGMKAALMDSFRSVQSDLAKTLGADPANAKIAEEIFNKLKAGVIDVETGIRGKIQGALLDVLKLSERIAASQAAATKSVAPVSGPAGMSQNDIGGLRTQITAIYPPVPGASLSSVTAYQAAINSLMATVARSKITMSEFAGLFNQVSRNPSGDFAGSNQQLANVQTSIQKVIAAYGNMNQAANASGQAGVRAGRSLYVSFDQFVKLLEVQVIHRIFGNLITEIQSSIQKAAELQTKISEVMTVSQGSGMDQGGMSDFIRQRSEMFNKPQGDVTEGLFQAFSSQTIKSANDLQTFDQALRLSQMTVSTVSDSVKLLTSVMSAYNQSSMQSEATANMLTRAVELGRFRVSDLAQSFGRLSQMGSQAGISISELLAVMTHMSQSGIRPGEAENQLGSVINAFIRPSAEMSAILKQWGFNTGEAAIRTLTLTGAISRLNQEVASGRHNLQDLAPSLRTMSSPEDVSAIGNLQTQINTPGSPSSAATGESPSAQLQKEVEKIRNMFLELGGTISSEVQKLAAPWGGISGMVQSAGSAIGDFAKLALQAVGALNSLASTLKPMGADLGTLIKLWIDYKLAMAAWSTVSALVSAGQSLYSSLQLQAAASTGVSTASITTERLARYASAQATTAQTGTLLGNSAGQLSNAAATTTATTAQVAMAGASRLLALAMAAIPILAIAAGVAYLTGQLDPLIDKFNGVAAAAEKTKSIGDSVSAAAKAAQEEANRGLSDQEAGFAQTMQTVQRSGGQVFQELTRQSNSLVEAQRVLVGNTSENARVALRGISDEMRTTISDLQRQISESRRYSEDSVRRGMSFGDRDQADAFKNQMAALSQKPQIIKPIDDSTDKGQEQLDMENKKYLVEKQQYLQQQALMEQRINQIIGEGNELAKKGDEASMQSSRRKFEEARRLMEQFYQSQDAFSRRTAENQVANGKGDLDENGVARYRTSVAALQRSLQGLTDTEKAAEEAHRQRLAAAAAAAAQQLAQEKQRQQALTDSIKQLEQLKVLDDQGKVKERYQGPQGMQNLNQDWQSAQGRLQGAMNAPGANFSPEARFAAMTALNQQYMQLQSQLQRENNAQALQGEQNLFNQRLQNLQRLRETAAQQTNELNNTRAAVTTNMTAQITSMMEQVNNATRLITGQPRNSPFLGFRQQDQINQGADAFRNTIPELNSAREGYARAQGTDQEAAAFARLRTAIQATDSAYRNLFGQAGANKLQNSQLSGDDVKNTPTNLLQNIEALQTFYTRQQQANAAIQATTGSLQALQGQVQQAAQGMGIAAEAFGNVGQAAGAQVAPVETFTEAIRRLADQMERLRNAPQIPPGPGGGQMPRGPANPAAPVDFEDEGFANGGLIGGRFNSFGPDDRLATVRTGEFVVNPASTSKFYSQLVAINSGRLPSFASGGFVGESSVTNVGDIAISVHDAGDPNATARAVLGTLRRELRRGNGKLN